MKWDIAEAVCLAVLASTAVSAANTPKRPAKIDTHAHFVPDFYAQALRDAGHLPGPDGMPGIPVSCQQVNSHVLANDAFPGMECL